VSDEARESVRRLLEAVNRRDVDAIKAEIASDFELHPMVTVWQRTYLGHAGVEEWQRDLLELWDEFGIEADEIQNRGEETVIVVGRWHGRPRSAPTPLEGPIAAVVRMSGGEATRADIYLDEAAASAAAEHGS
jgi:ketosteroid isomerase-like protein